MAFPCLCIIIFCMAAPAVHGSAESENDRTHYPGWCNPTIPEGSEVEVSKMKDREDKCCAEEENFKCGGGYIAELTTEVCSEEDAKVLMFEFKCYEDDSEYPIGIMILISCLVALLCVTVSMARWRFKRFQAPTVPKETAIFNPTDSKQLTRSNSGSDPLKAFARLSRSNSLRNSTSGAKGSDAAQLPNLFPVQADAVGKAEKPHSAQKSQDQDGGSHSDEVVVPFSDQDEYEIFV